MTRLGSTTPSPGRNWRSACGSGLRGSTTSAARRRRSRASRMRLAGSAAPAGRELRPVPSSPGRSVPAATRGRPGRSRIRAVPPGRAGRRSGPSRRKRCGPPPPRPGRGAGGPSGYAAPGSPDRPPRRRISPLCAARFPTRPYFRSCGRSPPHRPGAALPGSRGAFACWEGSIRRGSGARRVGLRRRWNDPTG